MKFDSSRITEPVDAYESSSLLLLLLSRLSSSSLSSSSADGSFFWLKVPKSVAFNSTGLGWTGSTPLGCSRVFFSISFKEVKSPGFRGPRLRRTGCDAEGGCGLAWAERMRGWDAEVNHALIPPLDCADRGGGCDAGNCVDGDCVSGITEYRKGWAEGGASGSAGEGVCFTSTSSASPSSSTSSSSSDFELLSESLVS